MKYLKRAVFPLLLATFISVPTIASAHSRLISSSPAPHSVLKTLPKSVTLIFNEPLTPLQSTQLNQIFISDSSGHRVESGKTALVGAKLSVALSASTKSGKVTVNYRIASEDGHPVTSSYYFTYSPAKK